MYSFGIDNNWKFTDAMRDDFKCEVHAFDPNLYEEEEGERFNLFTKLNPNLSIGLMAFSFTRLVLVQRMVMVLFRLVFYN